MILFVLLLMANSTTALLGFDCGGQHLNVTSISLLDTGGCDLDFVTPNSTEIYIQLLQLSEYNRAEVIQCKIEISRTIFHCGMHSHISAVHNGQATYLHETGYTVCKRLFAEGTMRLGVDGIIDGVKPNQTTSRSVTLAGTIGTDGRCKGTQYSDPYGTWDDVIVQASARITLKSSYVPVQLNTGKIMLKSGTICELREGFCIDSDDGYTYWKPVPTTSCNFHQYDVLYEGPAKKMQSNVEDSASPIIYSLTTHDITFALTKTKEQSLCGYTLLSTEHPKLFILENKREDTFAKSGTIPIENLDIFIYVNSKFVYVEKHIREQVTSLYYNVMKQKCELERQVITNTLSFASLRPDEFAYRLMKGPGYMAVSAGEAIHIVKCIPVDVTVRRTFGCYAELPVTLRNDSYYLTPRSRIITKYGTQKDCSSELPTLYRIEDTWIQFTPVPQVRQLPPQQLKPMAKLSWKYLTPGPLAISGIYSQKDLDKLRDHIMFPAEKPAIVNNVMRGLTGYTMDQGSVSLHNLLDEDSINKIAENAASRMWKGFMSFGSATAGVLGILLIIRLLKLIIDTVIHGYALHTAYGCSLHLIGAIWSSITHLLLHLARGTRKESRSKDTDGSSTNKMPPTTPQLPEEGPLHRTYIRMEPIDSKICYSVPANSVAADFNEGNLDVTTDVSPRAPTTKELLEAFHVTTIAINGSPEAPPRYIMTGGRAPTQTTPAHGSPISTPAPVADIRSLPPTVYKDLQVRLSKVEQNSP